MKPPERPLVVVRLSGGLGNQMFQYAAGRALALRQQAALRVDATDCGVHRGYELAKVFRIDPAPATAADLGALLGWRRRRRVQRVLARLPAARLRGAYVPEPHFRHWPGLHRLRGSAYLDGYWQSEAYFADVEARIRSDFAFRQPLRDANAEVAALIDAAEAPVSVHVRRGDYVADPRVARIHGTSDTAYYERALALLSARLPSAPRCFVFSDDPAWARAHLALPASTVHVEHNRGDDSHFDLQLMARCRHHVIANSSFSWWGAWLDAGAARIVVAPARWFRAGPDASTLLPPSWLRA
jgi:hypothetical protein